MQNRKIAKSQKHKNEKTSKRKSAKTQKRKKNEMQKKSKIFFCVKIQMILQPLYLSRYFSGVVTSMHIFSINSEGILSTKDPEETVTNPVFAFTSFLSNVNKRSKSSFHVFFDFSRSGL